VSDGERRRVQIVLGLLQPFRVLLLDEVTVDLDVLARLSLLSYLKRESDIGGATIIYATHIFDGLSDWPTHAAHLHLGRIIHFLNRDQLMKCYANFSESNVRSDRNPLLCLAESWLRTDYDERKRVNRKREIAMMEDNQWIHLSENQKKFGDKYYNYWNKDQD